MERLTDSASSNGDDFHLVVPSLPGYGFSGKPSSQGLGCAPDSTGTKKSVLYAEHYSAEGLR
jgi:hypothetical protein